jgi:lysine/ornithine N-monooxygenase
MKDLDLTDRVTVITGGASGAEILADGGAVHYKH